MDREVWRATVHGIAKSQTQRVNWACMQTQKPLRHFLKALLFFFNVWKRIKNLLHCLKKKKKNNQQPLFWPLTDLEAYFLKSSHIQCFLQDLQMPLLLHYGDWTSNWHLPPSGDWTTLSLSPSLPGTGQSFSLGSVSALHSFSFLPVLSHPHNSLETNKGGIISCFPASQTRNGPGMGFQCLHSQFSVVFLFPLELLPFKMAKSIWEAF